MDRTTAIAGGLALALGALALGHRETTTNLPAEPLPAVSSSEPARLDLRGVTLKPLSAEADEAVMTTAFPFSSPASEGEIGGPVLVTPQTTTPALVQTVPESIPLPSQSASPDPVSAGNLPINPPATNLPISASPAPSVSEPVARPAPLAAAVTRSEQLTREAFSLARRGAMYSARSRFFAALREIASGNDELNRTTRFTQALNSGLLAMRESHDFELNRAASTDSINVARVVAGHRTPVLKSVDTSSLRPAEARDRYQLFAVEQITQAIDGEPFASMSLFGLGRICVEGGKRETDSSTFETIDALVWYHAAFMADATNFRAAHELGTLYAQRGEWERARTVLQRSIAIHQHPMTWQNLALVHSKLGEHDWAAAARSRALASPLTKPASKLPPVQWVDAETFAKTTGPNEVYFPQQAAPPVAQQPATPEPRSAAKPKSSIPWLPWNQPQRR